MTPVLFSKNEADRVRELSDDEVDLISGGDVTDPLLDAGLCSQWTWRITRPPKPKPVPVGPGTEIPEGADDGSHCDAAIT